MTNLDLDFTISRLGECRIPSPMQAGQFVGDDERVLYQDKMEEVKEYLGLAEASMAARVKQAVQDLRGVGKTLYQRTE